VQDNPAASTFINEFERRTQDICLCRKCPIDKFFIAITKSQQFVNFVKQKLTGSIQIQ